MRSAFCFLFFFLFFNSVPTTVNPQEYAPVATAAVYIITIAGMGTLSIPVAIVGTAAAGVMIYEFVTGRGGTLEEAVQIIADFKRYVQNNKPTADKKSSSSSNTSSPAPQGPKKSDDGKEDKEFFESLKKRADKVCRSLRFGKLYRDPKTKLWWSKDTAHHGGSFYKVFREGTRGFEWEFDGDIIGKIIESKHKSPIGRFIPYKEVIFLK